jgi:hypothetical protein
MAEDQVKLSEILEDIRGAFYGEILDDPKTGNLPAASINKIVSALMSEAGLTGNSKSTATAALEFLEGRKSLTIGGKPFNSQKQESVRRQVLENNEGAIDALQKKTLSVSQVRAASQQALLDRYLSRLASLGIDAKRVDLVKAIKESGDLRGVLKKAIAKDEKGMLTKHEYEIAENDFIETFVASQLRSKLSPPKPRKYASKQAKSSGTVSPAYLKADAESKAVNSILGELGFATSGNIAGGITRGVALKIRSISMSDPETASMLLSMLTYDSRGKPRSSKDIAGFKSDWVKVVNAVSRTSVGSVEERITEALIELGDSAKRWAATKNLPFVPVFNKKGAVDIEATLAGYREGSKEYKALYKLASTLTLPQAEEAVSKVKTKRSTRAAADAERSRRKLERLQKQSDKRQAEADRASSVSAAVSSAKRIRKSLGITGSKTPQQFLATQEARLREIKASLSRAVGKDNAISDLKERQALADEAAEIGKTIEKLVTLSGVFSGVRLKPGERQTARDLGVKISAKKLESLGNLITVASDPFSTSLTLSDQEQIKVTKRIQTVLSAAGIKLSQQEAELILGSGSVMAIDEAAAARIFTAAKDSAKDIRAALDQVKTELGIGTSSREKAVTKAQDLALTKILKDAKSKNSPLNQYQEFAQRYIKAAQEEYASLDPSDEAGRLRLTAQFTRSLYELVRGERRLLSSIFGHSISPEKHQELTKFGGDLVRVVAETGPNLYVSVNKSKTGGLAGDSARSSGMSASGMLALGLLAKDPRILKGTSYQAIRDAAESILPGYRDIAAVVSGKATISKGKIVTAEEVARKRSEAKSTKDKEALETIRKILAGDKAAFTDPKEMLKLVSYISSARGGKLTATNFIQSLLQKASDQGKLGASAGDLSKLAGLFKMGADGSIAGPGPKALMGAGGVGLVQLADSLRKVLDPKGGDVSDVGKALGATITKSFLEGGDLFKKVATKNLEKTLTDAATETAAKLEKSQAARTKREERAAAGPRVRTTRAKLGELTKNETGAFVDSKGLPLGFKDRGFKAQGIPPAGAGALASYLVKQGLIEKPEDLVMSKGGRGAKPLIDLSASKFVSETAKEIAGIVQDVRAKAMKIDSATGGKLANAAAGSLADLVKGKGFESGAAGKKARETFNAAVDAAMQDATVKRSFTKGGVKQEQTAPEFLKSLQDQAAEKGKVLTPRAARAKFLKTFKGDAATAVASRLGVDVGAGADAGSAILGKLTQQQQSAANAKAAAKVIADLRKQVLARQAKLGRLAQGPEMTRRSREQYAQAIPFQQRMTAYDRAGLRGAPAVAAGGSAPSAAIGGHGMQFVPGATIAIPQVDIGPLKELASQMAEVGKVLALIPKATIPKTMSGSVKEIASLMQVLATVKSPPSGTNISSFKKLIQDLNSLTSSFGGKAPNATNIGNVVNAMKAVNKILDALSNIGTKTPAKTLLENMQEFKKSLSFIPKMFSTLGNMDFAAISNIGATIASTKFPSQQRLAGINEALLMIKQILETANGMKGGRMPTITGGGNVGGGGVLGRIRGRVYARQEALAQKIQGPGFGRYGRSDRFGARSIDAARAIPLSRRLDYYDQIRAGAAGGGGQRPPRERPVRSGGGGNRFGGGRQIAPAGQFGMPRQVGGPMGPEISANGVRQFSNDAMGILGNLAQQIRFGFTQEVTREIAQSFGRILAHLKDGIVKFNSVLETATVAFQTLFENEQKAQGMEVNFKKAKEEAEGLVEQLKKFANVTPFRFPQLAESARRMRAFGFETKEILPNMQAIGDAVAALGGEDDKIFRITYALGQMRQAGRVYQNDMMQLANAGIAGYDILSKALLQDFVKLGQLSLSYNGTIIDKTTIQTEEGYNKLVAAVNAATNDATRGQVKIVKSTSSEIANIFDRVSKDPIEAIRDLTQSGQIAGGAASSAIIEGLGQEYGGGMRKLSKTFEGAFSTLSDVTQAFVADITRPVFESIRNEMIDLGTFLQSMFVSNIVKNVAKGFSKIVGPVQEVIGSLYSAITSVVTGLVKLFGEVSGAFSLMDNVTTKFVGGFKQVTYTFSKAKGAGQEFITRIGGGLKIIADLMQFPLAKGIAGAIVGFKLLSAAWNMNPMLLTMTAITVGLTYLRDFLSSDIGKPFAASLSGAAASLSALARNFKQQILPVLEKIMIGIGGDFVVGLVASITLMIPILKQILVLFNSILEVMNAVPFLPQVMGLLLGLSLLRKMTAPFGKMIMGVPAGMDVRGNPIPATKGLLGTLESTVRTITAKLLPRTTLINRAPTEALQRLTPQVPAGTLGPLGRPSGFGAVAGGIEKVLVQPAQKKMLSSQMLKQLLGSGTINQTEYEAAMAARRAAAEAAARAGTGPGGISGLRELARTGGGTKAALKALGGSFADPTLNTTVRINSLVEAIKGMFKAFRNLNLVIGSINKVKIAGNAIGNIFKSIGLAAKSIPKAALSGINRLMKSFVLAAALKFNSSVFSLVPKVFVPFMDTVKTMGPRGTGGDLIGSVRRAASAGVSRAGRLSLAGAQVPFAMPRSGVTGGPLGYLVRAIRGLRPNRLPFEAPGGVATSIAQRIRPQALGGSPSMYGVSIFKVIQERIKYLTMKVSDTAGLYAARITTTFERSFMAFHRMMIRLAGAPARIFTMQNFDKLITRFAESMVKGFTPKTAPMAGFLAGGTKKAPTELFAGLKDAIARKVIPNTLVGAPGPTFTDKIFAGADKLAKVSERFAEMMVRGFAPKTVPIEKFLAGGTVRAPKELFTGLKDAIARIVIPDKFTQPISIFQRAVMFFKSATANFGGFIKGMGSSVSGAGSNLLSKFGTTVVGGGGAMLAAIRASKGMAVASSSIKAVGTGIMGAVNKIGKFNLLLTALLAGNTIRERIGAEGDKNAGAIVGQELTGAAGALIGGKVIGGAIAGRLGTAVGALGGPIGMIAGTIIGQMLGSVLGGLVFPGQEVTPADQEKTAKEAAVAEYMKDQVMSAQEFTQLLTDFNFTPIELLDMSKDYYGSVDSVFERIKNGVSTLVPSLQESLGNMLQGLGTKATEKVDGTSYMDFATQALEKVRAAMTQYYLNLGKSPAEAMIIAQNELAMALADFGQVKTLDEANSLLQQLASSWQVNIMGIKGFNLFIGGANTGLEKLQTNLEKIRSEFQKLSSRLQSRINAVFEQQMEKALEKAKDAFLATQMVMVDGAETNILALREEIEATEKRNKLLAIEKKLRDAARSVEMAKLAQYDASMDPLEAAARMREAQDAQTEAVKEAALERKKIALEEAMASDPVVAGLQNVDERFEAARIKFQEGMEDILDLVEQGKLTGAQAAAKIKELYTTTLGEVGVLDANLDVDAKNFGDSFLGTWETILKKFENIVTKLKKAIAAVNGYTPPGSDPGTPTNPNSSTTGLPNSDSVYGGRAYDNWRGFGIWDAKVIRDAIIARVNLMVAALRGESQKNMAGLIYTDQDRQMGYGVALSKAITSFTTPSGSMNKKIEAAKNDKNGNEILSSALTTYIKPLFKYMDSQSGRMYDLKFPLQGMASGGEVMGVGGTFQVGETGRETLQVVPGGVARIFPRRIRPISQIGMAGGNGGGVNASVIINNPTVRSDQDIRKLADAVGKAQSSLLRSAGIGRI